MSTIEQIIPIIEGVLILAVIAWGGIYLSIELYYKVKRLENFIRNKNLEKEYAEYSIIEKELDI